MSKIKSEKTYTTQEVTKMILMCNNPVEIVNIVASHDVYMNIYQRALCNTLVCLCIDYSESKDKVWVSAYYKGYFAASVIALASSSNSSIKDEEMNKFYTIIREARERIVKTGKLGLQ